MRQEIDYQSDRKLSQSRNPDLIATLTDLPPRDTVRWVSSRKAAVVTAVQSGVISLSDACMRYSLSVEEFLSWQRAVEHHGTPGLRITHVQDYRKPAHR